jgi:hypothetical protein
MAAHLPPLPIEVDPLIAEAKRRTRRRRILLLVALVAVAALAVGLTLAFRPTHGGAASSSADVMHGRFFRLPGNWAACEVDSPAAMGPLTGQRALSCVVFALDGARGQRTWSLGRTGVPRVSWILANIADTTPFLAHGGSWSFAGYRCQSDRSGLTCRNASRHGFTLNAKRQSTF